MKTLAGAVLILAAAVLLGTSTLARAIVVAANRPSNVDEPGQFAAVVVGLLGFILLVLGLATDALTARRE